MALPTCQIIVGDCRKTLKKLPAQSVHCVVTSPPYFGLRDYGTAEWEGGDPAHEHHGTHGAGGGTSKNGAGRKGMGGQDHVKGAPNRGGNPNLCPCGAKRIDNQIGLEQTPQQFIRQMVKVFREVKRVLRDDGTLWLNLGDSYAGSWGNQGRKEERGTQRPVNGEMMQPVHDGRYPTTGSNTGAIRMKGIKPKDLYGMPWRVAFALQADGWYLRSDIIWAKKNCMPESVTDRPTKSHEYIFLLTKNQDYYYDHEAIKEPATSIEEHLKRKRIVQSHGDSEESTKGMNGGHNSLSMKETRNKRTVWHVGTYGYSEAHFATFPPDLIRPCILAGCPLGGTVLDPFFGSGTTGEVSLEEGRNCVGLELNPEYADLARIRTNVTPGLGL